MHRTYVIVVLLSFLVVAPHAAAKDKADKPKSHTDEQVEGALERFELSANG